MQPGIVTVSNKKQAALTGKLDETKAAHTQQQQGVVCLYYRRLTDTEERGGQ